VRLYDIPRMRARGCICARVYMHTRARERARVSVCYILKTCSRNAAPFRDGAAPFRSRNRPERDACRHRLVWVDKSFSQSEKFRTSWHFPAFPGEGSPRAGMRGSRLQTAGSAAASPASVQEEIRRATTSDFSLAPGPAILEACSGQEPRKPRRLGSPRRHLPPSTCGRAAKPGQAPFCHLTIQKGRSSWQPARMKRRNSPSP